MAGNFILLDTKRQLDDLYFMDINSLDINGIKLSFNYRKKVISYWIRELPNAVFHQDTKDEFSLVEIEGLGEVIFSYTVIRVECTQKICLARISINDKTIDEIKSELFGCLSRIGWISHLDVIAKINLFESESP